MGIGDKVSVKINLKDGDIFKTASFTRFMNVYRGKNTIINSININGSYCLEDMEPWRFDEEMLELIEQAHGD